MSKGDTMADSKDTVAELIALEARRNGALVANDMASLGAMLADDLTYVHASGKLDTRATLLASIGRDYSYLESERGELSVRVYGDVAVMTGPAKFLLKVATKPDPIAVPCNITQVWVRQSGAWKLAAYHGSRPFAG
jgi:ketosteroid isomerase-like protein